MSRTCPITERDAMSARDERRAQRVRAAQYIHAETRPDDRFVAHTKRGVKSSGK